MAGKMIQIARAFYVIWPLLIILNCNDGNIFEKNQKGDPQKTSKNTILGVGKYFLYEIDLDDAAIRRASGYGLRGFSTVGGLAFDQAKNILYGIDVDSELLLEIDGSSGKVNVVGEVGFDRVESLAYDPNANILYGTAGDAGNSHLISIDTVTGCGTLIGDIGFSSVFSLAFDTSTNTLYGHVYASDEFISIDPLTGRGAYIGASGYPAIMGMSFDQASNTIYASDSRSDQIIKIDIETGAGMQFEHFGYDNMAGLAVDTNTGVLYGSDTESNFLLKIDLKSTKVSIINALGFDDVQDLAYDPNSHLLFGIDGSSDSLIHIDRLSGRGEFIGKIGFDEARGLAFDPNANKLYGSHIGSDQLLLIDTTTGEGNRVGNIGFAAVDGLAFDSNDDVLYGWNTYPDQRLIQIDPTTGSSLAFDKRIGTYIQSMTFEPKTNVLYGSDAGLMKSINTGSGQASNLFSFIFPGIDGITIDPIDDSFYCTNHSQLVSIDSQDLVEKTIGSIGFNALRSLAHDSTSDELYGVDYNSGTLLSFEISSGNATLIGRTARHITGLAYDSNAKILYGIRQDLSDDALEATQLISIDTESGTFITIGRTRQGLIESLAFDPTSQTLFGTTSRRTDNQLLEIDIKTGRATPIGELGAYRIAGLVFDPRRTVLYGSDTLKRRIIIIDPENGKVIDLGPKTGASLNGLAYSR